jgi:predicted amidohydrolase YtcJ
LWAAGAFPTAADLDAVAPEIPAFLVHKSGHAAWVNSAALRRAGVDATTPDPVGGQVQRNERGEPTGILLETAMNLVRSCIPVATEDEVAAAMLAAQRYCWQVGLTGIHDFDGRRAFRALQMLHAERELGLRVVKNIPVARLEHAIGVGLRSGFGDDWLRIGGVKIFADGALGPRTAYMIAPYAGEADNRGMAVTDKEEMMALASEASANGLAVTVHAIGDRANHDVLDVYAAVREEEAQQQEDSTLRAAFASRRQLRHRIEHVQLLHPDDQQRLAQLAVIASMQPIHATSDMQMADRFWGERSRHAYAWRTVLASGATLVFGSDAPVEPIAPLPGIHAAVTRRRADGSPGIEGWYGEQRLTVGEAVYAFTAAAAFTGMQEGRLGTLAPRKLADLTIFDADLFSVRHDDLLDVGIAGTIVGGEFKYRTW